MYKQSIGGAAGLCLVLAACLAEESGGDHDWNSTAQEIRGTATVAGTGVFEAVVSISGCTGTLITKDAVLTAAHCVCTDVNPVGCQSTTNVVFDDVVPASGGSRTVVIVPADIQRHPDYNTSWLANDYAVLKLRRPAHQDVQVTPIRASMNIPAVGTTHTLVGYGGYGTACANNGNGTKRYGTTALDTILVNPSPGGKTMEYLDTNIGACPGDSGGPAIYNNEVVGVSSHGDSSTNSNYDPTGEVTTWLRGKACPYFDPQYYSADATFCDDPMCLCVAGEGDCDADTQCETGHSCVQDIGAANGSLPTQDLCWNNQQLVTFYTGTNFTGGYYKLPIGTWDYATLMPNLGNDNISSLQASPGLFVNLYAEQGCWGDSYFYWGANATIGALMDNRTSCLKVTPGVSMYSGTSYSGTHAALPIGSWNHTNLWAIGNDTIESIIAGPGIQVKLCTESGYPGTTGWGTCAYYSGSVWSLLSMNNTVSNVEVLPGATVYREMDYGGISQTFRAGTYNTAALTEVGNNTISSLVVAPGMKATLCTSDNLGGTCRIYTGWNSFVGRATDGTDMNDGTSSLSVSAL